MKGRVGIAVAGGHEAGRGLFRPDVSMAEREPQEAAKVEYRSSPSSPSTSPTPSPPQAAAGQGGGYAAATPHAWSLGGEQKKPSEASAGDNGNVMQIAGDGEQMAGLSSGRRRGRPRGSGRRQILATLGEWYALSAGGSFTPHVIIVPAREDVAARIMSFSQRGPRSVCILAASGTISNVAFNKPGSSGSSDSTFTYEGLFEILQLTGSFTMAEEGGRKRTGGLSVSLAGPDGRVIGGVVAGVLRAATPIQVIVGSFLPNSLKQHQRRMGLQPPPSAVPALPLPEADAPPPVLTAAMPISQAAPGNGRHGPPVPMAPLQVHANVEHTATTGPMNLNSSSTGFTMVGWPVSAQPMGHRPSPDINLCLTPQE
ncbi:AT-hook motif nuclear-localized protein 7-like [Hordeum vulgare]|nr:AT-hook motif nuclear-localized protein 7-like [Hordeum vulgare]